MIDCRVMITGPDRHATFFCECCAVGGVQHETRRVKGRIITEAHNKVPGKCTTCNGTGKGTNAFGSPAKHCHSCGGSGVCPECNGSYARTWDQLPVTAQAKVLSRLEHNENLVVGYEYSTGLFREY